MDDKKDMSNSELKIYFDGRFDAVKEDLTEVKDRLKAIEKEIHSSGNGKPGISIRLDRLENLRKWLAWVIPLLTALLVVFFNHYFSLLEK